MIGVSIHPVIVKSKVLADGSHKIRLAVAHNGQTRYLPTRFVVPSDKNVRKGLVVGLPNAAYINRTLQTEITDLYAKIEKIDFLEVMTCSQLVDVLTSTEDKEVLTLSKACEKYLKSIETYTATRTKGVYEEHVRAVSRIIGDNFLMCKLSPQVVNDCISTMDREGMSPTTIRMRIGGLKTITNYCIKHRWVSYDISPFIDVRAMASRRRKCDITPEQLRKLRDYDFSNKARTFYRDLFMLSFYLCGINLADLVKVDLSGEKLCFRRTKTENRRRDEMLTEFTIQPEARVIIDRIYDKMRKRSLGSLLRNASKWNVIVRNEVLVGCNSFIYYSARKTWAQFAAELGVQDSVIEYCIGDSVTTSVIGFYRLITPDMADAANRRVIDFLNSGMSIKEYLESEKKSQTPSVADEV